MPHLGKRRSASELETVRSAVLFAFSEEIDGESHASSIKRARTRRQTAMSAPDPALIALCQRLVCISKDNGVSCMSQLKDAMKQRTHSSSEVAKQVFSFDEIDLGPPLCAAVHLLSGGSIHLRDVPPEQLLSLAVLELRNPEMCSCRGKRSGLQAIMEFILRCNHSVERDVHLRSFLAILFRRRAEAVKKSHTKELFRVVETFLTVVDGLGPERYVEEDKMQDWVRKATLPTLSTGPEVTVSEDCIWDSELSGLAVGRRPSEYLVHGHTEEHALTILYKSISSSSAATVYLECMQSFLRSIDKLQKKTGSNGPGAWSRVVLLGRRVVDTTWFSDASSTLKRSLITSLTGSLFTAVNSNKAAHVTVIVCFLRALLIRQDEQDSNTVIQTGVAEYGSWLTTLVTSNEPSILGCLLKPFGRLLALEPLQVLRVNHKVFSLKREFMHIASEYLVSVRTRISGLNVTTPGQFLADADRQLVGEEKPSMLHRLRDEILQYVIDYSKDKKIPSPLVRKMNFHRHYFRKHILKVLLDPELGNFFRGHRLTRELIGTETFDEVRVRLIDELAFKRKDRAVTVAEATSSIDAIRAASKRGDREFSDDAGEGSDRTVAAVTEKSSTRDVCAALFERCEIGSASQNGKGRSRVIEILVKKLSADSIRTEETAPVCNAASEVLTCVASVLEERCASEFPAILSPALGQSVDSLLKLYADWWSSLGNRLFCSFLEFFEHPLGKKIQASMRYQLFSALYTQGTCMTEGSIVSLAMITMVLAEVTKKQTQEDPMGSHASSSHRKETREADILSTTVGCLPLKDADATLGSVQFTLHCLYMCVTCCDFSLLSRTQRQSAGVIPPASPGSIARFAKSSAFRAILDLLRWIMCHPWRLSESPLKKAQNRDTDARAATRVLASVARMLCSHRIPTEHELEIDSYFCIEERPGWGNAFDVYKVLKHYEMARSNPMQITLNFALFLSKREFTKRPSILWIENAVMRFVEDTPLCSRQCNNTNGLSFDPLRFLEHCAHRHDPALMFRLLHWLPLLNYCYFHNSAPTDVEQHLASFIVPRYWPLPHRLLDYLWMCMNKSCTRWKKNGSDLANNFLLLSNFAVHGLLGSTSNTDRTDHTEDRVNADAQSEECFSNVATLKKILLQSYRHGVEMNWSMGTQGAALLSLSSTEAKALGSCVILELSRECQLSKPETTREHARTRIRQVTSNIEDMYISDFIDSALSVSSLLPFSRLAEEWDRGKDLSRFSDCILHELLEEQIRLLKSSPQALHWARTYFGNSLQRGDIRANFVIWLGRSADARIGNDAACLDDIRVDLCLVRLLQSMCSLGEESLNTMIAFIGRRSVIDALIPNTVNLNARAESHGEGSENFIKGSLCAAGYRTLQQCQSELKEMTMRILARIFKASLRSFRDFGDGVIEEALDRCSNIDAEIRSGIRVQFLICKNDESEIQSMA